MTCPRLAVKCQPFTSGVPLEGQAMPTFTITIDDEQVEVSQGEYTAAAILDLVDLPPEDHCLIQLTGKKQHELEDADVVHLTPATRFITRYCGPTPVA